MPEKPEDKRTFWEDVKYIFTWIGGGWVVCVVLLVLFMYVVSLIGG